MRNITNKQLKKDAISGVFGNILEWYDFAVFGFLAPILSLLFFPNENKLVGIIMTYGIFATGYLMRPLGGIIFGYIGDKMGRKLALNISILMMAIPTFLIGFLPTFQNIGVNAAILLVILRMAQGLAVGGELIGSVSYLVEIAPQTKKGFYGSFTLFSAIGGLLLGSSIVSATSYLLGEESMLLWGWRVPFLLGIIIFSVGVYLRKNMSESPEFSLNTNKSELSPLKEVMKQIPMRIRTIQLFLIIGVATVSSYMLFVWMPTYLGKIISPPISYAMLINTITMVIVLITIPIAGKISDIYGKREIIMMASLTMGVVIYPLFLLIGEGSDISVIAAQFIFAILAGFIQGPLPALMVEMFPAKLRYTAMGISYNSATAILGGTTPMIATLLIEKTGNLNSPAIYLAFFSFLSFITLYMGKFDESKC